MRVTVGFFVFSALFALSVMAAVSCGSAPKANMQPMPTQPSVQSASSAQASNSADTPRSLPVVTPRREVVETLHGKSIVDPYRWLEQENSEVSAWADAQNRYTRKLLDKIPQRETIQGQIAKLMSIGDISPPRPRRTPWGKWRYFYTKREGMSRQPSLLMREGIHGNDIVLVDVSALSHDGTTALDWVRPSLDGTKVAYGLSEGGTENSTLYVLEIARDGTVKKLADVIDRTRHCSVAWKPDSSGFYYTRYPSRGQVPDSELMYHRKVYEHVLGRDANSDPLVFGQGREMTDGPSVQLSSNGRWLVVTVYKGPSNYEIYLRDLRKPGSVFEPVVQGRQASYGAIATDEELFLVTDDEAPKGRVMRVDPKQLQREKWKVVIPEAADALSDVSLIGGQLVAVYLHDAMSRVERFDKRGKHLGSVDLPSHGTAVVRGAEEGRELFLLFGSFAVSAEVYRVALPDGKDVTMWQQVPTPIDASKVVVQQFAATSKDGTKVPYFAIRNADVPQDGTAAVVISGYGGFGVASRPWFLGGAAVLLQHGGVIVQTCLRGGSEYGEAWHKAGMLENKQNVFDDMIAITQDVVGRKIAAPDRIGIRGMSNGGLLVGAVLTQRPELFRVAVASVPLLDMLRYHHFLVAKTWIPEYGSSDDPEMFDVLRAYSPYHNIKQGVKYPATLLTAAWGDSRVPPLHALKMTAALQHATGSDEPIIVRIESKAGHGAGKPLNKRIDETTDVYGFLMWKLGLLK